MNSSLRTATVIISTRTLTSISRVPWKLLHNVDLIIADHGEGEGFSAGTLDANFGARLARSDDFSDTPTTNLCGTGSEWELF